MLALSPRQRPKLSLTPRQHIEMERERMIIATAANAAAAAVAANHGGRAAAAASGRVPSMASAVGRDDSRDGERVDERGRSGPDIDPDEFGYPPQKLRRDRSGGSALPAAPPGTPYSSSRDNSIHGGRRGGASDLHRQPSVIPPRLLDQQQQPTSGRSQRGAASSSSAATSAPAMRRPPLTQWMAATSSVPAQPPSPQAIEALLVAPPSTVPRSVLAPEAMEMGHGGAAAAAAAANKVRWRVSLESVWRARGTGELAGMAALARWSEAAAAISPSASAAERSRDRNAGDRSAPADRPPVPSSQSQSPRADAIAATFKPLLYGEAAKRSQHSADRPAADVRMLQTALWRARPQWVAHDWRPQPPPTEGGGAADGGAVDGGAQAGCSDANAPLSAHEEFAQRETGRRSLSFEEAAAVLDGSRAFMSAKREKRTAKTSRSVSSGSPRRLGHMKVRPQTAR